ncbi:MAG TPA: hypothetical protein VK864_13565, partial [Longimicrobiales bacterium]|nr:hypothetical protein [Longimicrobiales bacterium]
MKSQKRWWVNPLVALVSFFAALALAEAAVRWFAPQPPGLSLQDRYGLTMHYPGIKTYLPQHGVEVSFNRAGMRDREHAEDRPANGFRIL